MRAIHSSSISVLLLVACSGAEPVVAPPAEGPVAASAREDALAQGVPGDLVLAMAAVEGGLRLPARRAVRPDDDVAVAGILELRHAHFDSLARGAALSGVAEEVLRADTDLGTVAGIRVLAELGAATAARANDAASWAEAVERMSGYRDALQARDYAARVFRVVRRGGAFAARDGETVTIPPHPEVPVALTMALPLDHTLDTPEFAGATWFQTDCTNKCSPTRTQPIDAIVLHDTEAGWDASVASLQTDANRSVHYIVDADGSRVGQFLPESYAAWHAGNACWNNRSIGIEHVGHANATYDAALYAKSVELVQDIRSRHTIPLDRAHLVGHYQVPNPLTIGLCVPACDIGLDACATSPDYGGSTNARDPGANWQWCEYMEMLGGMCACNDVGPLWGCTTDGSEMWRCNYGTLEKKACPGGCTVAGGGKADQCKPAPDGGSKADASSDAAKEATNDGASDGKGESAADAAKDVVATDGASDDGSGGGAGASAPDASGGVAAGQPGAEDSGGCSVAPLGAGRSTSWGASWLVAVALAALGRRSWRSRDGSAIDGGRKPSMS